MSIGLAIGAYGLTQAMLQIPFGYLSDKYGRKPMLLIGIMIFIIGSIISSTATSIEGLILGRVLQGSGAISSVLMAFMTDYVEPNNRIKANAFVGFMIGLSFIMAIIIAPELAEYYGISGVFNFIAILAVLSLMIALTLPSAKKGKRYEVNTKIIKNILSPRIKNINFSILILHMTLASSFIVVPTMILDLMQLSDLKNWNIYAPAVAGSFITMVPLMIMAHKKHLENLATILAIAILIVSQLMMFFIPISAISLTLSLLIFFTAFNAMESYLPSQIASSVNIRYKGLAMGFFTSHQFIGSFLGAMIASLLIYTTQDKSLIFMVNILLLLVLLSTQYKKR
jgi:MFS family permease